MKIDFESLKADEVIRWALNEFKDKVALSSSFSAEDVVIIDMMISIGEELGLNPNIFTIDTGRLPNETYEIIDRIRDRYKIEIKVYFPNYKEVEEMVNKYRMNLFYESIEKRKLCCEIRKVKPLKRALEGLNAWITGLRREQSITRKDIKKVEIDDIHNGIYKINPIADWSEVMVWNYIKEKKLPYNTLYDKGYTSIGCEPCTRAIKRTEDIRNGRWWWESPEHKECGIHTKKF
ncbi:MAG: phosphoadenylyl-sulfate reductase [Brevinematales bacterium]|nr:phosphoadenylyl-sulfate reductase [Brevinematales bacterium]